MLEIAIGTGIAIVLSVIIRTGIAAHRRRMEALRFFRDQFFELAQAIVKEGSIDDARLARLKGMILDIDDARTFRILSKVAYEFTKDAQSRRYKPSVAPEVPHDWAAAAYNYFLAVSYTRLLRGYLLRDNLARALDPRSVDRNTDFIEQRVFLQLQPA